MFNIFNRKSVDALIAGSNRLIARLEAAAEAHHKQATAHAEAAEDARIKSRNSYFEATRATNIAEKLKGIFS